MPDLQQFTDASREKLNLETAQIAWRELQRFFAQGMAVTIAAELDLLDVAHAFAVDNSGTVKQWMRQKQIENTTDEQALQWLQEDAVVWAVIVKPWVLVQQRD